MHDLHVAAGARFAPFAGWQMPLEYAGSGTLSEHAAVREAVGLFDVSHLGTVRVAGAGAGEHVDRVLSNALSRIGPGRAQYTLCLTEEGGIVDDLIVYLLGPDELLLVPNAANAPEVVRRLRAGAPGTVEVQDRHTDTAVLAVQGPRSQEVMAAVGLPHGHEYMSFATVDAAAGSQASGTGPTVVCRTGYTGEHGYEVLVPAADAAALWQRLADAVQQAGGRLAGLGARDTLRTEMGYPLHGSDIDTGVSPLQARLGFALGWDKPDFVGKEALLREKDAGPARLTVGLRALDRGVPRAGMTVHPVPAEATPLGEPVGRTTSGTFSPTLRQGIALALLDSAAGVGAGDTVALDVRGRVLRCEVVRPPFVPSHVRD